MSYIIVATVSLEAEENFFGNIENVDACILRQWKGYINFDIRGDFSKSKELTKKLCNTLIDAGFISFEIRHSY